MKILATKGFPIKPTSGGVGSSGIAFGMPNKPLFGLSFPPEQIEALYPSSIEEFQRTGGQIKGAIVGGLIAGVPGAYIGAVTSGHDRKVTFTAILRNGASFFAETDGKSWDALNIAYAKARGRAQFDSPPPVMEFDTSYSTAQNAFMTVLGAIIVIPALAWIIWLIGTFLTWKVLLWIVLGLMGLVAFFFFVVFLATADDSKPRVTQETADDLVHRELAEQAKRNQTIVVENHQDRCAPELVEQAKRDDDDNR